jgi:pimeloyl-ACP methyl ester carboxylesterase
MSAVLLALTIERMALVLPLVGREAEQAQFSALVDGRSRGTPMAILGLAEVRERDVLARDGRRLHLYESGDPNGELVFYHHGTPGSGAPARWWAEDAKARGIRLVGYDRPGYGGSERHSGRTVADAAADVAAIADALGVARFRTWGASGGGPHALACAAALPDRVIATAAVACVAPYGTVGLEWMAGMGQDNVEEFGAALNGPAELDGYLTAARTQILATEPAGLADALRSLLPEVDVAALDSELAAYAHEGFAVGLQASADGWLDDDLAIVGDWGLELAGIATPVLVVHGRHDLMVPFAHGRWLVGAIPGAHSRLSETDGHLSLVRAIDQVHAWLLDQKAPSD